MVEDVVREAVHESTHDVENKEAGSEHDAEDDETVLGKEDEFEEVANEWNSKGGDHDADNSEEEASAKFVEWARNPIDENKIN